MLPLGEPDAAEIPLLFGLCISFVALVVAAAATSRKSPLVAGASLGISVGWAIVWFLLV